MTTPIANGSEFQINSFTAGDQAGATVTALSDGGFVVVWTSALQDGSGFGVYTQRYDAAGDPVGSETKVNTTVVADQGFTQAKALADGGIFVAWSSEEGFTNPNDPLDTTGSIFNIYGQRYAADGIPVGGEILINTTTQGDQRLSSVTTLADSRIVVTWASDGQDGDGYGIFGQILFVPAPGTIVGTPGDDTLVGTDGDDIFIGGADADTLSGNEDNDVLNGGAGDDFLSAYGFADAAEALTYASQTSWGAVKFSIPYLSPEGGTDVLYIENMVLGTTFTEADFFV